MSVDKTSLGLFSLLGILATCSAYNIDVKTTNHLLRQGTTPKELFGYSLTLHDGTDFAEIPTLFVGAPLGDGVRQKSVDEGSVYECELDRPNCKVFKVDRSSDIKSYEYRKKQWLGALVFSNGKGPIVVCAPRYSEKEEQDGKEEYYMIGKCALFKESGRAYELYPCARLNQQHERFPRSVYGFCEAGFSAVYTPVNENTIMGTIGTKSQRGAVALHKWSDSFPKQYRFSSSDQTGAGFYLGYSVTYGNFYSKDKSDEDVAAGTPRFEYSGKVTVYRSGLAFSVNINPPERVLQQQEFIYFGAAVCAVDVNNDGYSDLIVGAPFFSTREGGDEGRVYVYLSTEAIGSRKFSLSSDERSQDPGLHGSNNPGARFGWAIAKAGDLNFDGFDDFIVGAPHDAPDTDDDGLGNGAIYIYHGRKDGKIENFKQKITAKTVEDFFPSFKQFGYAVAGNVDTNDDKYPDIAIGAWQSERVLLLRTRPVMNVKATLRLSRREIPVDNFTKNCGNSSEKQCLEVEACFTYSGKSVSGKHELKYTFELDTETVSAAFKRVYFSNNNKKSYRREGTVELTDKNNTKCATFSKIFVEDKNRLVDVGRRTSDITFQISYELISPPECETSKLCPVLDDNQEPSASDKATLVFNCSDNTCDHDLRVNVSLDKNYITIGKSELVIATVELSNIGEISYNPEVTIIHDPALQYETITPEGKSFNIEKLTTATGNETVSEKFRVQGQFDTNRKVKFLLQYRADDKLLGKKPELSIDVVAKGTSGQEQNDKDNNATVSVLVRREVIMVITGTSTPKLLNYPATAPVLNMKNKTDFSAVNISDVGPKVTVTIVLENKGSSPLQGFPFHISYPLRKLKGGNYDYIVYPVNIQEKGSGTCNKSRKLNPEKLNVTTSDIQSRKRRAVETLRARTAKSQAVECTVHELKAKERFSITFEFRLWTKTLAQYYAKDLVVKIEAVARYTDSLSPNDEPTKITGSVDIHVSPENPPGKSKSTPVWVIIVSVLGGVLLLALAILALFKLGFFKRNRPPKDISSPQTDDTPPIATT